MMTFEQILKEWHKALDLHADFALPEIAERILENADYNSEPNEKIKDMILSCLRQQVIHDHQSIPSLLLILEEASSSFSVEKRLGFYSAPPPDRRLSGESLLAWAGALMCVINISKYIQHDWTSRGHELAEFFLDSNLFDSQHACAHFGKAFFDAMLKS